LCCQSASLWRDKLIAYIDLDDPLIDSDNVDRQHQLLHVTASPSLRQLVDSLADEVLESVLSLCRPVFDDVLVES